MSNDLKYLIIFKDGRVEDAIAKYLFNYGEVLESESGMYNRIFKNSSFNYVPIKKYVKVTNVPFIHVDIDDDTHICENRIEEKSADIETFLRYDPSAVTREKVLELWAKYAKEHGHGGPLDLDDVGRR